eukprot:1144170-Pelagomonas_calceolata.AAC.6
MHQSKRMPVADAQSALALCHARWLLWHEQISCLGDAVLATHLDLGIPVPCVLWGEQPSVSREVPDHGQVVLQRQGKQVRLLHCVASGEEQVQGESPLPNPLVSNIPPVKESLLASFYRLCHPTQMLLVVEWEMERNMSINAFVLWSAWAGRASCRGGPAAPGEPTEQIAVLAACLVCCLPFDSKFKQNMCTVAGGPAAQGEPTGGCHP